MLRRLFTLLSAVSLVLCLGTCVLWVRSYWVADELKRWEIRDYGTPPTRYYVELRATTSRGRVVVAAASKHIATKPELWSHTEADGAVAPGLGTGAGWERGDPFDLVASFDFAASSLSSPLLLLRLGIGWWGTGENPVLAVREVAFPHAVVAAASAAAPVWCFRRQLRRRRRTRSGLCAACGYDLRATPGRCPECGKVPSAKGAMT